MIKKCEKILEINTNYRGKVSGYTYGGISIKTTVQEILILIDEHQQCCEHFGYITCEDDITTFIGATIADVRLTDVACKSILAQLAEYDITSCNTMFVDVLTDKGILQFAVYNEHNGYYGHDILIKSNQLNITDCI